MNSKKKITKLKVTRKNKRLQKGGANYTMNDFNDGRLPIYADVFVPDYYNPYPPNIAGGRWYRNGMTRDGRQKFRWAWTIDEPTCGDGIERDDRLWCANRGRNQRSKDNWCRQEGWHCSRCANSGYCTHANYPVFGQLGQHYQDDDDDDDDDEWEQAPAEAYDPQDPLEVERAYEERRRQLEEVNRGRRERQPCNPVPKSCNEVSVEDGKVCLGGRCAACENNEDIKDLISQEKIPIGKGVCIDKQCYDEDNLREWLEYKNELPHNKQPFTIDELDNALQQVICTGESGDPGPSSSRDPRPSSSRNPGPSSSSQYEIDDVDTQIEELQQQAQQIQVNLTFLLQLLQTLEQEIRGYTNINTILEEEITRFIEQYSGIISDAQLREIIENKQRNLSDIKETISRLQSQLDEQKRQKQELEDNLVAIMMVLEEYAQDTQTGGKKYKNKIKNRKNTKKYKNKIKNRKNTKKYKNKK